MSGGMNARTGLAMSEDEHIAQSIGDILTTAIGSRVTRRPYGSIVPELIDQPGNAATTLRLMAGCVSAINRWEPRVRINRITLSTAMDGTSVADIQGIRTDGAAAGSAISLSTALTA